MKLSTAIGLATLALSGTSLMHLALSAPKPKTAAPPAKAKARRVENTATQAKTPAVGGELKLIGCQSRERCFRRSNTPMCAPKFRAASPSSPSNSSFPIPQKLRSKRFTPFPLPNDAAVNAMEFQVGARRIVGEIKRREEARQIYDQAKTQGKRAALLDQERPNIFTQAVANVLPGDELRVKISFVQRLPYKGGAYEWAFPHRRRAALFGPGRLRRSRKTRFSGRRRKFCRPLRRRRLVPGHDLSLRPPPSTRACPSPISARSLHPVEIRKNGARATCDFAAIKIRCPTATSSCATRSPETRSSAAVCCLQKERGSLRQREGGGYFSLVMQPPAAPKPDQIAPRELVFVVDQTGSQSGWPIAKAKETMRHALGRLRPGDTFQVLGFNTSVYPCFAQPVAANPANIKKARAFIEGLQAQGGTDILQALRAALKIPLDRDRLRVVVYLTDGYVDNDREVIAFLRENRGTTRVFPFGMGNSVNRFLLDNMAREGRGAVEYVTVGESRQEFEAKWNAEDNDPALIEKHERERLKKLGASGQEQSAVERFYQRIATPVLVDPQIDWGDLPVAEVQPEVVPDLFENGPVVVTGRFTKAAQGEVVLRGWAGKKRVEQRLRVDFGAAQTDNPALETLWAREKIGALQAQDYGGAQNGTPDATIKDQIVQTALDHDLMTQWTSFVAVEQKVVNPGGENQKNDVPVEIPDGVDYQGATGVSPATPNPSTRYSLGNGNRFAARPGDPLIRIGAPQNARRVLAILPDGQILPLSWNSQTKAWEARFDVPGYVADGAYRVAVIIERADGKRSRFELIYRVDTQGPRGDASLRVRGSRATLQLAAGADVSRVTAILPWNARVELRRGALASAWIGAVEVPQNWRDQAARVRFILTDAAHNRTEIEVDWSN